MDTPLPPSPDARPKPSWPALLTTVVLLALAWYLRSAVMLFFGAVLVAATLRALAEPLHRVARMQRRTALTVVLILLPLLIGLTGWLIGDPLAVQLQSLSADLPKAWASLRTWLQGTPLGSRLLEMLGRLSGGPVPWSNIAGFAGDTVRVLSEVVLILMMGIYLAFDTGLYKRGLIRLVPVSRRAGLQSALDEAGHALGRWLLGQGVAMVVVGVMVAIGLSLLNMPLAIALGVIAGLLEFVPYFGPIASALLAVLVAFAQGPQAALYVALLFIAVQQLENHVLIPLIQRWAVELPPLLGVGGVIVFGTVFGVAGVAFGTPLMVVTMVLVRKLYVEQTLEGRTV